MKNLRARRAAEDVRGEGRRPAEAQKSTACWTVMSEVSSGADPRFFRGATSAGNPGHRVRANHSADRPCSQAFLYGWTAYIDIRHALRRRRWNILTGQSGKIADRCRALRRNEPHPPVGAGARTGLADSRNTATFGRATEQASLRMALVTSSSPRKTASALKRAETPMRCGPAQPRESRAAPARPARATSR